MSSSFVKQDGGINYQTMMRPDATQSESYFDMRKTLVKMGIPSSTVDQLSLPALTAVAELAQNFSSEIRGRRGPGRPRGKILSDSLSPLDEKLLRALLSSIGAVSSAELSNKLDIPLSTVHRRRIWLESQLLDRAYALKTEMLGIRTAELFISTDNGATTEVAKALLELRDTVFSVWRTMSESGIDLEVKIFFRDHEDLAGILETISSIEAVDKVRWYEQIEVVGRNEYPLSDKSIPK